MEKKIMTHPELYEESLRLQDLVEEYRNNNDYKRLEKVLLELDIVYDGLNYCDEDEYLDDMCDLYKELYDMYYNQNEEEKLIWCFSKMFENYDNLIQRDKGNNELIEKHKVGVKELYEKYNNLNINEDILKEYPRLKEYL